MQLNKVESFSAETITLLKRLIDHTDEVSGFTEELDKSNKSLEQLHAAIRQTEQFHAQSTLELHGPNREYQAAVTQLQNAQLALQSAKRLFDAYQSEKSGPEVTQGYELEDSPVLAEYQRTAEMVSRAESNLASIKHAYDKAKRRDDELAVELKALQSKAEAANKEQTSWVQRITEASKEIDQTRKKVALSNSELDDAFALYMRLAHDLDWLDEYRSMIGSAVMHSGLRVEPLPRLAGVTFGQTSAKPVTGLGKYRTAAKLEHANRFLRSLQSDLQIIDNAFGKAKVRVKEALQRRSSELLDQQILEH